MQFSTGSVGDREMDEVGVEVHNAGIQPANATCTLITKAGSRDEMLTKRVKIGPRQEMVVLRSTQLGDGDPELVLEVDSPSLIVLIKAETRKPLHFKVVTMTDRPAVEGDHGPTGDILFSGCLRRGDPF